MLGSSVIVIGYSGHAYTVCDIYRSNNHRILGYCEREEKTSNPYNLNFLGSETEQRNLELIQNNSYFVGIGDNMVREKLVTVIVQRTDCNPINAIHRNSSVSSTARLGTGVMVADGSIINACAVLGNGVICNTQSVVEHECVVGNYSHIAPGAVLCGNVYVGRNCMIGARSVVKQGVKIGDNVTVGAGTVVIYDIPSNTKVVGNPQKIIN